MEWRRPDRRTPSKGLDDAHHRSTAATHEAGGGRGRQRGGWLHRDGAWIVWRRRDEQLARMR